MREVALQNQLAWENAVTRIARIVPHLLFLFLLVLIFQPSLVDIKNPWIFLGVVGSVEFALLWKRQSAAAHDIVTFVFLVLLFWEFVTTKIFNPNTMLYPVPENVFAVYYTDWHKILTGIGSSLYLLGMGFVTALVFGFVGGMITGWNRRLREALFPIAKVISPIPPIIYTPYAVALLPSFELASIFVIFSSIFWQVYISVILSVTSIDRKLLDSARTLNMKPRAMLFHILFPYCLPKLMKSLPISIANAFMVLTAAEMIGATAGLGWFVKYYSDFSDYTRVIAGIILIGVVVSLINLLIAALERRIVRWR
jgi:NitT/TauT family transport system permease protein